MFCSLTDHFNANFNRAPVANHHPNNPSWGRVTNKFQLIEKLSDEEHKQCFFLRKQDLYRFRNAYVYPMLAQLAGAAQGLNAAASLPISLTADALTAMFLLKLHQDPSYRLLG